jgi:hypothetical protein
MKATQVKCFLQWGFQPTLRSASWTNTLRHQRSAIDRRIKGTPSLKPLLEKPDWVQDAWDDALVMAQKETGIDIGALPDVCPWAMADVLADGWLPK